MFWPSANLPTDASDATTTPAKNETTDAKDEPWAHTYIIFQTSMNKTSPMVLISPITEYETDCFFFALNVLWREVFRLCSVGLSAKIPRRRFSCQ